MSGVTEISASLVKQLRDQTGAGMMACKQALQETGGDLEAARVSIAALDGLHAQMTEAGISKVECPTCATLRTIQPRGDTVRPDEVGWVPQQAAVYSKLSVAENLRLFARVIALIGETADQQEAVLDGLQRITRRGEHIPDHVRPVERHVRRVAVVARQQELVDGETPHRSCPTFSHRALRGSLRSKP